MKILADEQTDKVLMGILIGPHAGELIAEILQWNIGASAEDIARIVMLFMHPTVFNDHCLLFIYCY